MNVNSHLSLFHFATRISTYIRYKHENPFETRRDSREELILIEEFKNHIDKVIFFFILEVKKSTSDQIRSVTQSCPTLCDPMNHSMPGLPVHHQLPEFTQTHVHRVGDAIQPSHPLSSPSPPAPNPSRHQSLFQ